MKRTILMMAIIFAIGFTFTSCKKDKKEDVKTEVKEEMASNEVYQCPMNCEKGKSYTKAGKCPVCEMDLKAKKVDLHEDTEEEKDSTAHEGHDQE